VRVYVDGSVILRVALGSPNALAEWDEVTGPVASVLVRVECARTLERLRIAEHFRAESLDKPRRIIGGFVEVAELININTAVLTRAAQPFDYALKTLDAIHLATAMLWREENEPIAFATHDYQLAQAAKSVGFRVLGVPT
jgi:predicted nucleic acid-binding protein